MTVIQEQAAYSAISEEQLLAALKCHFSYDTFRPNQQKAIEATLAGKDSLLIIPTGAGKSMTFQLPPLAKDNCFTVVIGPLLALMKDQVEHCLELGIDARVWNSDVSEEQRKQVLSELVSDEPEMRLLYTTPESLRNPTLRSYLKEAYDAGTLLSFAIDEAHCVSDWGHDFRPAYLELASLRDDFPKTPIAAMTASCTSVVEAGIIELLCMRNPVLIKGGFNRPNIAYKVVYKEVIGEGKQDEAVEHLIQFIQERQGQCGIIYARLRATCDWLCSALCSADMDAGCYHAGKDAQKRRKTQQDWCTGATDIVVATVAFGMGIDRADVRWVVHWDVPASLEGFYQESGRAGRDGQPSESVMYVSADDLDTLSKLEKGNRSGSAAAVAGFSCQPGCKRKKLIDHFGGKRIPCDAAQELLCDYCSSPKAVNQLLQQWEQQVTRRSVQHQLRQQRQQQEEGDDSQQSVPAESCDANTSTVAADGGDTSSGPQQQQQQQQLVKPRPGVWGSARAQGLPTSVSHQQNLQHPSKTGRAVVGDVASAECSVLQGPNIIGPAPTFKADETNGSSTAAVVSGVKPPTAAAVMKPQLTRKRPGSIPGAAGAFKAPRMMQSTETGKENQPATGLSIGSKDLVSKNGFASELQHPQPCAVGPAASSTPSESAAAVAKGVTTATAAATPAPHAGHCSRSLTRTGRARHAFVPPLKRS